MNMKTKNIIFGILCGIAVYLSLIFGQILQIVLAIALPIIVAYIFIKLNNKNIKLYFIVATIILLLSTALNLILNQIYDWTCLLPLFGGLVFTLSIITRLEYWILIKESNALRDEGKYQESLYYLDKLSELGVNNLWTLYRKAAVLGRMGKYQDSLELTNKILKKEPKFGQALASKASVFFKQGDYQKAITYYEDALGKISTKGKWKLKGVTPIQVVALPRELAEIWVAKGKAHQKLQQYSEALECFDKALELRPDYDDVLKAKGEVLKLI